MSKNRTNLNSEQDLKVPMNDKRAKFNTSMSNKQAKLKTEQGLKTPMINMSMTVRKLKQIMKIKQDLTTKQDLNTEKQ